MKTLEKERKLREKKKSKTNSWGTPASKGPLEEEELAQHWEAATIKEQENV